MLKYAINYEHSNKGTFNLHITHLENTFINNLVIEMIKGKQERDVNYPHNICKLEEKTRFA